MERISASAVLSALADDERLRIFAGIATGGTSKAPAGAERKALARLLTAGLVEEHADGSLRVEGSVFRDALASLKPAAGGRFPANIARFFDERGRIERIPANAAPRHALLSFLVSEEFAADLPYSEAQVNHALRKYHEDYSMLRRYSVDLGLLRRSSDGAEYRRAPAGR